MFYREKDRSLNGAIVLNVTIISLIHRVNGGVASFGHGIGIGSHRRRCKEPPCYAEPKPVSYSITFN